MRLEAESVIDDVVNRLVIAPISNTHIETATKIAERALGVRDLDLTHHQMDPRRFTIGEFCPLFILTREYQDLQGKSVYIVMTPGPYKDQEGLVKRAEMVAEAARVNGASRIVLLATDLPHSRQDRGPDEDDKASGELNTVRLHARTFECAGIDQVITTHTHSLRLAAIYALEYGIVPRELLPEKARDLRPRDIKIRAPKFEGDPDFDPQIHYNPKDPVLQELGKKVFQSISPYGILADYILHHSWFAQTEEGRRYLAEGGARLALKALDKGNRPGRDQLRASLYLPNIVEIDCEKARKVKNDPSKVEVPIVRVSDNFRTLDGMCEILADDGADTCGTLIKSAAWSDRGNVCANNGRAYGTPAERFVYFTHAWLGGESHLNVQKDLIKELPAREFVTSNSRPYINDGQDHRFKARSTVLRLAGLWADAILANELGHDITTRYVGFSGPEEQHEFLEPFYALKRHSLHFMVDKALGYRDINFRLRE